MARGRHSDRRQWCGQGQQNRVPPALYSSLTWSVREAAGRDWRGDSGSGSCRDLDGWGFIAAKPRQFARDDRQTPGRPGGRADDQPFESGGQTHHSPGRTDGKRCAVLRSEEHTSELQSLMRISYAVFCLKKKNIHTQRNTNDNTTHDKGEHDIKE